MKTIAFIDTEVSYKDLKAKDLGVIKENGDKLHTTDLKEFFLNLFLNQILFVDIILLSMIISM